jgi:phospholipid/cholesterol/gamma-HCH transport system substrate-binding protein
MSENSVEVIVGGVVLAAALGFVLFAAKATGYATQTVGYPLVASFRSVEGISVGTDVKLAGVKVGTITGLSLNPKTYFADATIEMKNGIEVPDDSAILISQEGLLGGNFVELVPGGSLENLKPGGRIQDTQGAVSLVSLLMKFVGGGAATAAKSNTSTAPAPNLGSTSGVGTTDPAVTK